MIRRAILVLLVLASGCAALDNNDGALILASGSHICTAPTLAKCEEMQRVADSLHTGRLAKDIAEARK